MPESRPNGKRVAVSRRRFRTAPARCFFWLTACSGDLLVHPSWRRSFHIAGHIAGLRWRLFRLPALSVASPFSRAGAAIRSMGQSREEMMAQLQLSIAMHPNARSRPVLNGFLQPDGIDL